MPVTPKILVHKEARIALHLLVWVALLVFPLILLQPENRFSTRTVNHIWVLLGMMMTVFYTNYLWAVNRFALQRKLGWFVLVNLLLFALLFTASDFIHQWITSEAKHKAAQGGRNWGIYSIFVYRDLISYTLVTGIAAALRVLQRYNHSEAERKRLTTENLQSEISLLKYQIQPHFFFNTLNNIYALIAKSPAEAQQAVHRLSKLMRYILYDNGTDLLPLDKEIEFLENYNQIMKLRLTASTRVEVDYLQTPTGLEVPPLLFVSLLENAYKHGISNTEPSFIANRMYLNSSNQLVFQVDNSLHRHANDDTSRSGIGLQNLKKRLDLIYPNRFELILRKESSRFSATLILPVGPQKPELQ